MYKTSNLALYILQKSCSINILEPICHLIYNYLGGYDDPEQTEQETIQKFVQIFPDTVSIKQLHHFAQIVLANKFQQFDYGGEANLNIYGSKDPPEYDLNLVNTSVALYVGQNDRLSTVQVTNLILSFKQ